MSLHREPPVGARGRENCCEYTSELPPERFASRGGREAPVTAQEFFYSMRLLLRGGSEPEVVPRIDTPSVRKDRGLFVSGGDTKI